jgi:hypothetical protein
MQALTSFMNNPLAVSIFVILISSLVGFYVSSRIRDRCLRDFDGFMVTVEDKAGKIAWGTLRTYSSGMEMKYGSTVQDTQGHVENSYILYDKELANLQAIYRFHDDQTEQSQKRRTREIRRTYQPTLFRRALRALRNLFNTFKDAIVQATNTVLGYRAAQSPTNLVLSRHKELTDSGMQLLAGAVGNAYEPILERYIGQYVVVEVLRGTTVEEEYGILKEYTAKYLELLNVKVEVPPRVFLKDAATVDGKAIQTEQDDRVVRVTNPLARVLFVEAIKCGDRTRRVDVLVPAQGDAEIALLGEEAGSSVTLDLSVRCLADLIVPRAVAAVRHAGKREKLSLETLLGLDDLPDLPWVKRLIGEPSTGADLVRLTLTATADESVD